MTPLTALENIKEIMRKCCLPTFSTRNKSENATHIDGLVQHYPKCLYNINLGATYNVSVDSVDYDHTARDVQANL